MRSTLKRFTAVLISLLMLFEYPLTAVTAFAQDIVVYSEPTVTTVEPVPDSAAQFVLAVNEPKDQTYTNTSINDDVSHSTTGIVTAVRGRYNGSNNRKLTVTGIKPGTTNLTYTTGSWGNKVNREITVAVYANVTFNGNYVSAPIFVKRTDTSGRVRVLDAAQAASKGISKPGSKLVGWSLSDTGSDPISIDQNSDASIYTVSAPYNTTLFAVWRESLKATFKLPAGDSVVDANDAGEITVPDGAATAPAGHTFKYWTDEQPSSGSAWRLTQAEFESDPPEAFTGTTITENKVFYPVYVTSKFTVTFFVPNGLGGMSPYGSQQEVLYGDPAQAPADPDLSGLGLRFTGWDKAFSSVTENLVVNALTVEQYTVTFYDKDGIVIGEPQKVDAGSKATAPTPPTFYGYNFLRWEPADFASVTSDMEIHAVYDDLDMTRTIRLYRNRTSTDQTYVDVTTDRKGYLILPPASDSRLNFTHTNSSYVLGAWGTSRSPGNVIDRGSHSVGETMHFPQNTSLYAMWIPSSPTLDHIDVRVEGGNLLIERKVNDVVVSRQTVTLTVTNARVRLNGGSWINYNSLSNGEFRFTSLRNLSMSTKVEVEATFTITGSSTPQTLIFTMSDEAKRAAIAECQGTSGFDFIIRYGSAIKIFTHTVNFEYRNNSTPDWVVENILNGGSISAAHLPPEPQTWTKIENGFTYTYTFLEWVPLENYGESNLNNVIRDMTYYARYFETIKKNAFLVTYVTSGAPGNPVPALPTMHDVDSDVTVLAPVSVPGYDFTGWTYTDEDGNNVDPSSPLGAGATFKMPSGNVTLTGIYTLSTVTYKVRHYQENLTGGGYTEVTGSAQTLSGTYGATITPVPNSYDGFTFMAGKTQPTGTITVPATSGSLEIKLYYDRSSFGYTVNYYLGSTSGTLLTKVEDTALFDSLILYVTGSSLPNGVTLPQGYKTPGTASGYGTAPYKVTSTAANNVVNVVYEPSNSTIKVEGTKRWAGDGQYLFMRPRQVTIGLFVGDATQASQTTTASATSDPAWKYSFDNLPEFSYDAAGIATTIQYRVEEINPDHNYLPSAVEGTYHIQNTFIVPKKSFAVQKIWRDDGENQNLTKVDVTLQGYVGDASLGNNYKFTASLKKSEGWAYVWTNNLPEIVSGSGPLAGLPITYKVTENVPNGYTAIITPTDTGATITNIKKTTFKVEKKWLDGWGTGRPGSVTVTLSGSDGAYIPDAQQNLSRSNGWDYTWDKLPKFTLEGDPIAYSVAEVAVQGYASSTTPRQDGKGATITNTKLTSFTINKTWVDLGTTNRPASAKVRLYRGDKPAPIQNNEVELSNTYGWTHTWTDLPKYDSNNWEISYSVKEFDLRSDYQDSYEPLEHVNGVEIKNKLRQGDVYVRGTKTWIDDKSKDPWKRPDVTINLYRDGKLYDSLKIEHGLGGYDFGKLPKYAVGAAVGRGEVEDGHTYLYTVEEVTPDTYTSTQDGRNFTNTIKQVTISVDGTKKWDDEGNKYQRRPGSVQIQLKKDGVPFTPAKIAIATGPNWNYSFPGLDKYKYEGGKAYVIDYSVEEISVLEGYTWSLEDDDRSRHSGGDRDEDEYDIVNKFTMPKVSFEVTKTWVDGDGELRPDTVRVRLLADGEPVRYQDTKTLSEGNRWTAKWERLPKYKAGGDLIVYSAEEIDLDDDVYVATYTQVTAGTGIITNRLKQVDLDIGGAKKWVDDKAATPQLRPTVTINLYRDDVLYRTAQITGGVTSYLFEDLPKYAVGDAVPTGATEDGHTYRYRVEEAAVPGYDMAQNGFDFTNTITQVKIGVRGKKSWMDSFNFFNKRPGSVEIELLADGEKFEPAKTVSATGSSWTYSFTELDKYRYDDDHAYVIDYSVQENDTTEGYTSTKGLGKYDIINWYVVPKTTFTATKEWVDGNASNRPTEVWVTLTADNVPIPLSTRRLTNGNGWTHTWDTLPVYKQGGGTIVYGVVEYPVPGNYTVSYQKSTDGLSATVTNTIKQRNTQVTGTKVWVDDKAATPTERPTVTINLMRDNVFYTSTTIGNGVGSYSFTDLPMYAVGDAVKPGEVADGHTYIYTVEEVTPDTYDSVQAGTNFVNTIKQVRFDITGTKTWVDDKAQNPTERPDVKINLYRDDVLFTSTEIKGGGTSYLFEDLPTYALGNDVNPGGTPDGHKFTYRVEEVTPDTYSSAQDGQNFTNTIRQVLFDIEGSKSWVDHLGDTPEERPDVTINLYRDEVFLTSTIIRNGGESYSFTKLPTYAVGSDVNPGQTPDGHKFVYRVEELTPSTYESDQDGEDFFNTIKQVEFDLGGSKTWIDGYAETPELRPTVTINLWRDNPNPAEGDEPYRQATIAGGGTSYLFEDLPTYAVGAAVLDGEEADGHVYTYHVTESPVEGYSSEQDGLEFTNTKLSDVTIRKVWDDGDAFYRPATPLTLELLKNGAFDRSVTITDPQGSGDDWSHTFKDLPEYDENGKIDYKVNEPVVPAAPRYAATHNGLEVTNTSSVTITFVDYDGSIPKQVKVKHGGSTTAPTITSDRVNYTFIGWDKPASAWEGSVTRDTTINAVYALIEEAAIELTELGIPLAGGTVANVGDSFD